MQVSGPESSVVGVTTMCVLPVTALPDLAEWDLYTVLARKHWKPDLRYS